MKFIQRGALLDWFNVVVFALVFIILWTTK